MIKNSHDSRARDVIIRCEGKEKCFNMAEKKRKGAVTGRQKVFKTPGAMMNRANEYFDSISVRDFVKDEHGEAILNENGNKLWYTKYLIPPSVQDLCLFLGIVPRTWEKYCQREEFHDVTAQIRLLLEGYLVRELNTRELDGRKIDGIKFNLTHNYNWKEKREVELGAETRRDTVAAMSLAEKQRLLREAAAGFSELMGDGE